MIPYCLISREAVLAYLRRYPDGRIRYRIASHDAGGGGHAHDPSTHRDAVARSKRRRFSWRLLSEIPTHATVPPMRVGQSQGEYLGEVVEQMHQAGRRAGGGSVPRIAPWCTCTP